MKQQFNRGPVALVILSLSACASGEMDQATVGDRGELSPGLPQPSPEGETSDFDGQLPPGSPEPLAGGETSDFGDGGQRACSEVWVQSSEAEALAAGFDVAAALELFDTQHHSAISVSACSGASDCAPSMLSGTLKLDSVYRIERSYTGPEAQPAPLCPDRVGYRSLVHLDTEDDLLSGVFYAKFAAIESDEGIELQTSASPDLRNFSGRLRIEADSMRPHFALMEVRLVITSAGIGGFLRPFVGYTDAEEPQSYLGTRLDWSRETTQSLGEEVFAGNVALDSYQGSEEPPKFKVEARIGGTGPGHAKALDTVTVVDGSETQHGLLAGGTQLDLGELETGAVIEVRVGIGPEETHARTAILVDNCFRASSFCSQAGCATTARLELFPSRCDN